MHSVSDAMYLPIPDQPNPPNASVKVPQVTARMQLILVSSKKDLLYIARYSKPSKASSSDALSNSSATSLGRAAETSSSSELLLSQSLAGAEATRPAF